MHFQENLKLSMNAFQKFLGNLLFKLCRQKWFQEILQKNSSPDWKKITDKDTIAEEIDLFQGH